MSKFCPNCGEELVDNANFCKNCGKDLSGFQSSYNNTSTNYNPYQKPVVEKSHTLAVVLGVLCAFLIPILGVIFGVYILTRNDNEKSKSYGSIIIAISVVVWVVSFLVSVSMF